MVGCLLFKFPSEADNCVVLLLCRCTSRWYSMLGSRMRSRFMLASAKSKQVRVRCVSGYSGGPGGSHSRGDSVRMVHYDIGLFSADAICPGFGPKNLRFSVISRRESVKLGRLQVKACAAQSERCRDGCDGDGVGMKDACLGWDVHHLDTEDLCIRSSAAGILIDKMESFSFSRGGSSIFHACVSTKYRQGPRASSARSRIDLQVVQCWVLSVCGEFLGPLVGVGE